MSEETQNCSAQTGGYLAAFAIGALLGAGLAIVYAPCSGREVREALARRTEELKEKAGGVLGSAKDAIREKKAEVVAAVQAGKEAMRAESAKHSEPA